MNLDPMNNLYEHIDDQFSSDSFSSETDQSEEQPHLRLQLDLEASSIRKKRNPNPNPKPQQPRQSPSCSNGFTISFGNQVQENEILSFVDSFGHQSATNKKVSRNPAQAQDHVLAERKRREKLTRRFISLSSLLPDLKKMDKASVLEDAISYIKELKGRVKELERVSGAKRKDEHELAISAKRSWLCGNDTADISSSEENNSEVSISPCKSSPDIEVKMSEGNVLVTILCEKTTSSPLLKSLNAMQELGLSVISSNAMPFADTTFLINLVAQMEDNVFMTEMDLVKKLRLALI